MTRRPTLFQSLRQERRPLALLAMLALGLRVTVIMIGLAVSPGVAGDGLGILCQPSAEEGQTFPRGGQHDPAHCICGPACTHGLSSVLTSGSTDDIDLIGATSIRPLLSRGAVFTLARPQANGPIRAPPVALT